MPMHSAVYRNWDDPPEQFVPRRVNHRLHLTMSITTLGVWAVAVWWWLPLYVRDRNQCEYWRYLLRLSRYESQLRARQEDRRRLERAGYC
jgi:hypothetical protein